MLPPISTASKRSLQIGLSAPAMGPVIEEAEEGEEEDDEAEGTAAQAGGGDATPREDSKEDGTPRSLFTGNLAIPAFAGRKLRIPVRLPHVLHHAYWGALSGWASCQSPAFCV